MRIVASTSSPAINRPNDTARTTPPERRLLERRTLVPKREKKEGGGRGGTGDRAQGFYEYEIFKLGSTSKDFYDDRRTDGPFQTFLIYSISFI